MKRRWYLALGLTLLSVTSAQACVLEITTTGSKRMNGAAVGEVLGVEEVRSVAECNRQAQLMFDAYTSEAPRNNAIEAITVQCLIPEGCQPADANIDLFSRVVILID